jgi:Tfp pilus assembly protein PilP
VRRSADRPRATPRRLVIAGAAVALLVGVLALAGCGESAQAKAKKQVCTARNDIAKQIATLQKLTLNASAATTAKASFEAIGRDVTEIKNVQKGLDTSRRKEVEAATQNFVTQISTIAAGLSSKTSLSNAAAQFKSALSQLATAYSQSLGSINCL